MQLGRLLVRNIRSYAQGEVRFGPGITLLWGDVGSGKTSLLYAVEMALFGFAEVDPAFLVRHQAAHAEVRLGLDEGTTHYEVRRRFKRQMRKGKQAFVPEENTFARDGASTSYSATELRQRAIDLLGFPDNPNPRAHSDFWRWAVYVPQERMRDVLEQEPNERLETVRKALGVEKYRTAAENAVDVAVALRHVAQAHEEAAQVLSHWESELPRLIGERQRAETTLLDARRAETDARQRLESAEKERARLEEELRLHAGDRREAETLEREAAAAARAAAEGAKRVEDRRAESSALAAEATRTREGLLRLAKGTEDMPTLRREEAALRVELDRLEADRRELATAEARYVALQEEEERAGAERVRATEALRSHTEELALLEREGPRQRPPEPTPRTLAEIGATLAAKEEERLRGLREVAEAEHELSDLRQLREGGVCPRCHQSVRAEEFGRHEEEARKRLEACVGRRDALQADLDRLTEVRASRERFERALLRWESTEGSRARARRGVDELDEQIRRLDTTIAKLREERGKLGEARETLRSRTAGRDELLRRRADIERRLREGEAAAEERVRAEATLHRLEETSRLYAGEAEALRALAEKARARVAELRSRLATLASRIVAGERLRVGAEAAAAALAPLRAELDRWVALRSRAETDIERLGREIARAEEGVADRLARQREADRARALGGWLSGEFRDGLLILERRLLAQAQGEFDRLFSRYFASLVEDPSLQARSDSAFSPTVEIDGEWTPAAAMSGGERTALALAFRLALGAVVRHVGRLRLETLILDEPTDGFSPEQVQRVGELLREIGVPQIILVSHESELAGIADRVIRVRKESGLSTLSEETTRPSPDEASAAAPPEEVAPPARRRRAPRPAAPPTAR